MGRSQGRRALVPLFVLLLASAVILCTAQVLQIGFEEPLDRYWEGPMGGGSDGGTGTGAVVPRDTTNFVHSGARAVCLKIWDNGNPRAIAWAALTRKLSCSTQKKITIGTWLYASSSVLPMTSGSVAHVRIEYFEDPEGRLLIPSHVSLSKSFDPATFEPDRWHFVEANDRIPPSARSIRVSVVMTAQNLQGQTQALWLDDLSIDLTPEPLRRGLRRPSRLGAHPTARPEGIVSL